MPRPAVSDRQLRFIQRMVGEVGGLRADAIYREVTGRVRYALPYPARYQALTRAEVAALIEELKRVTGRA